MRRYFFDVVGDQRTEYDYHGSELPTPEKAYELANLIALDLAIEPDGQWNGWAVKVCSAEDHQYFTVPVQSSCLSAA